MSHFFPKVIPHDMKFSEHAVFVMRTVNLQCWKHSWGDCKYCHGNGTIPVRVTRLATGQGGRIPPDCRDMTFRRIFGPIIMRFRLRIQHIPTEKVLDRYRVWLLWVKIGCSLCECEDIFKCQKCLSEADSCRPCQHWRDSIRLMREDIEAILRPDDDDGFGILDEDGNSLKVFPQVELENFRPMDLSEDVRSFNEKRGSDEKKV